MDKLALEKEAEKVKLKEQYNVLQETCSKLHQKISEMLTTVTQLKEDLEKKETEKKNLLLSLEKLDKIEDSLAEKCNSCDELLGQLIEKDSLITKLEDKPSKPEKEMKEIEVEKKRTDNSGGELECTKKPIEILEPGFHIISTTNNGESMLFYEPCFLEKNEAKQFFKNLYSSINWCSKNIVINGKEKPPSRMVAWFGPYPYSFCGSTLEAALMPDSVFSIKQKVETCLWKNNINAAFNSVILNFYRTNKDSVAWHSDDPVTTGICPTIASVSLGETRRFDLRPKKKCIENENPCEKQTHYFVQLMNGSLIVMDGCMQDDWQHRIPKEYDDKEARINLTFRTVYPLEKNQKVLTKPCRRKHVDIRNAHKVSNSEISFNEEDNDNSSSFINDISPACSGERRDMQEVSNLMKSDVFKKSDILCDSEASFGENLKFENDTVSSGNTHDVNDSVGTNSSECHSNDSTETLSNVIEKCIENKEPQPPPKKSLNVLAKAFVPSNPPAYEFPNYKFSNFTLEELLYCEVTLLHDHTLMDFAHNLKIKVTERLFEFLRFDRQELEFLCLLIDRSETEKNQKLITSRIIKIVLNNLERPRLPSYVQKYHNRPPGYRKQYR